VHPAVPSCQQRGARNELAAAPDKKKGFCSLFLAAMDYRETTDEDNSILNVTGRLRSVNSSQENYQSSLGKSPEPIRGAIQENLRTPFLIYLESPARSWSSSRRQCRPRVGGRVIGKLAVLAGERFDR
jgi:hypothetical protein